MPQPGKQAAHSPQTASRSAAAPCPQVPRGRQHAGSSEGRTSHAHARGRQHRLPWYLSRDRETGTAGRPCGQRGPPTEPRVWTRRAHPAAVCGARALGGETERGAGGRKRGRATAASPRAGERGCTIEKAPTPLPALRPEGTLCASAPGPRPPEQPRTAQYLRIVCVMDIWRCSAGREGSWWGEGTRAGSTACSRSAECLASQGLGNGGPG